MRQTSMNRSTLYAHAVSAALLSLSASSAGATVISGAITNPANGHIYRLLDAASWTDSESEAAALGGHLVSINDDAENNWIFDTFVPLLPSEISSIWLGLNDAQTEGTFVWASGEAVTYTNWSIGQPDDAHAGEDFVHLWTPGIASQSPEVFRQWNDFPNDPKADVDPRISMYGIVETIPEPSSVWLLATGLFSVFGLCGRTGKRQA